MSRITVGTHMALYIKVSEADKVIENPQRKINIAFVNESAKIFNLINIDTHAVLKAADTKWNFLPFKPGLFGRNCMGVDPYYLPQRAQEFGFDPEITLAGRRLDDSISDYVASQIVKLVIKKGISVNEATLLLIGITFKENCPDVRNTRIVDVIAALTAYGISVSIYDPLANPAKVLHEYGLSTSATIPDQRFDAVVLGVAHHQFMTVDLSKLQNKTSLLYDLKGMLANISDERF